MLKDKRRALETLDLFKRQPNPDEMSRMKKGDPLISVALTGWSNRIDTCARQGCAVIA